MLEYFASEAQTPEIKFLDSRTKKFFFLAAKSLGPEYFSNSEEKI